VHLSEDNQGVYYWLHQLNGCGNSASAGMMKTIVMLCYLYDIKLAPEWRCSRLNVIPDVLSGILNGGRKGASTAGKDGDKKSIADEMLTMWSASRNEAQPIVLREDVGVLCPAPGISVASRYPLYDALHWARPPTILEGAKGTWGRD
jgi:hypothetical protein